MKSAGSSPKKVSLFRGRCGDCDEKGHKWRGYPNLSGRGGDGIRKGSQKSQDGSRSNDSANSSGKYQSIRSEKPKVVSATAMPQGPLSQTRAQKEGGKGPRSRARIRQKGVNKSVSRRAVFVEPLASDNDDEEHIWVKMPRAAVEEQLTAEPESRTISYCESETYMAGPRRLTVGKRIETFGDMDIGAVDVESL